MNLFKNLIRNRATSFYHELIDLESITTYMEYLVKLKTNGFNIKGIENIKGNPYLMLEYNGHKHSVNILSLKDYFPDLNGEKPVKKVQDRTYDVPNSHNINIGDIFYQIHGVDNTMCNFYVVYDTRRRGTKNKRIKVKLLENNIISFNEENGNTIVEPSDRILCNKGLTIQPCYDKYVISRFNIGYVENQEKINFKTPMKKWHGHNKLVNDRNRIQKREF